MDEYYCPNCNAILNDQAGFDPDNGTWICQECGETITEDEISSSRSYEKSKTELVLETVNSVLDIANIGLQIFAAVKGIDINQTTEDDYSEDEALGEDEHEDEYEYSDDNEDENEGFESDTLGNSESSYSSNSHLSSEDLREFAQQAAKKELARQRRKKYWKIWIVLIIISAAGLYIGYRINEYRKLTVIGISAIECKDSSYAEIKRKLQEAGFSNITTKETEDLSFENINQEGHVIAVTISGQTDFSADSKFPYDARIIIEYHSVARIKPPIASKDAKGRSCDEILKLFQDAGFGAVSLEADYDLLLGWINKDGSVESVSINGDTKYSIDSYYRVDAEIVIVYHAFRRDKDG